MFRKIVVACLTIEITCPGVQTGRKPRLHSVEKDGMPMGQRVRYSVVAIRRWYLQHPLLTQGVNSSRGHSGSSEGSVPTGSRHLTPEVVSDCPSITI